MVEYNGTLPINQSVSQSVNQDKESVSGESLANRHAWGWGQKKPEGM